MASSSSSSSSIQAHLVFGIEMEFLFRPRRALMPYLAAAGWNPNVTPESRDISLKAKNRAALRLAIAEVLSVDNILASSQIGDYTRWTIADERSLDEVPGFWRIELVSRTMSTDENWQREIDILFSVLANNCDIHLTNGCAMHIHVSPSFTDTNRYTLDQLKKIMKAIVYFDQPITDVMPANRKNNEWAMSNLHAEKTPKDLNAAYLMVEEASWKPVFRIFDKLLMKQQTFMALGGDRSMSWNFSHIASQCGTVEFRRPPGVKSAAQAKHWTSFALGFISNALATDFRHHEHKMAYPSVHDLMTFIMNGNQRLERNSQGAFKRMVADPSKPTVYTAAELAAIKQKKAEKAKRGSAFVEKANSRPNTPTSPGKHSGGR